MKRIDSTKIRWRVQVRKSRAHKWVNKGLFETRSSARIRAMYLRDYSILQELGAYGMYGFGNTRVVPYVKGGAK